MKILNYGSLNIDYTYSVEAIVRPGETVASSALQKFAGGKGLNQSIAFARAGGKIYHAGKIGAEGKFLTDFLNENNVDISNISACDTANGHAIIQVEKGGQNCILLHKGANGLIEKSEIDRVLSAFSKGDMLILQNEINNIDYIINKSYEKGMFIVFNPSPVTENMFSYPLRKISMFILNEHEGARLADVGDSKDIESIKTALKEKYSAVFVLTLGEKGAVYFDKETEIFVPAKKVTPVDTTGAGDTFTGYFLFEYSKNKPVNECLQTAAKASAAAICKQGAATAIPLAKEILV